MGQPIFVCKVEPSSLPEKAGLRVGDQILDINGSKSDKKELKDVSTCTAQPSLYFDLLTNTLTMITGCVQLAQELQALVEGPI